MASESTLSRREFVKNTGLLLGFSLVDAEVAPRFLLAQTPAGAAPTPGRLDAWLRIESNSSVRIFTGKVEIGMGIGTAYAQIVAEELDLSPDLVSFVMGDTLTTSDQGGVGGSTSVSLGARPLRNVAATARAWLVDLAARRLDTTPDQLDVRNGTISVKSDAAKRVSYGELAATADLRELLKVSGAGFGLNVEGTARPKNPAAYTIVGTSVPRVDIRPKVLGRYQYVTDVRVPGMLHGKVIRPSGVGAKVVGVNEDRVKSIPGYVRTVVKGNFVGVVAETEWAAIKAARALTVTWSAPAVLFPDQKDLYGHMRGASPKASRETLRRGDAAAGIAGATTKV